MRLAAVARAAALAVVFALAAVGSALLHLGLPAPRRFVEARVNGALAAAFAGRIAIQRIGLLRFDRVGGVDVEVFDPEGQRVLELRGVRAQLDVLASLRSLAGRGPLVVRVTELAGDDADVVLEENAAGELGLRRALEPREPTRDRQPAGRGIEVALPHIHLEHARIRGHLPGAPAIDAELDDLAGAFRSSPGITSAEVQGRVGQIPVRVAGALRGQEVVASLDARVGDGALTASATATLPSAPRKDLEAAATIEASALDLSLLPGGAPPSRLTAVLHVSVSAPSPADLSGTFDLSSEVGRVRDLEVPAARIRGELTRRSVRGSAEIAEKGAPTLVQFSLRPDQLALQVDTTVPDLNAITRVGPLGRGRAHLVAQGGVDLATRQISATAEVVVSGVEIRGVRLARGVVTGSAEGPLASPRFTARLLGTDARAGGYRFTTVRADASGSRREANLVTELHDDAHAVGLTGRAHVSASEATAHLDAFVVARLGEAGRIEVGATDVAVPQPATEPASWRSATGRMALRGTVDLDRLLAQLPRDARPVGTVKGTLFLSGDASRSSIARSPTVALLGRTEGLAISSRARRWHTAGVDGSFAAKIDPSRGVRLEAKIHDHRGTLASLEATASLSVDDLTRAPRGFLERLRDTPFEASLSVPRRSLAALPPALGELPLTGDVELAAALRGTARAPRLTLNARGTNLRPRAATSPAPRADVDARLAYDGEKADVHLVARGDGRPMVKAGVTVTASAAQAMTGEPIAWEASGDVAIEAFPLDAAGALLGLPLAGSVSGQLAFRDLHRAASLEANLGLDHLTLDHTRFPHGEVRVSVVERALSAAVRLQQVDGYATTELRGAVAWGAALAPHFDPAAPFDLVIRASNLRADAAMPFVAGTFRALDGRIDADAQIHVDPGGRDGHGTGAVVLRDGVFEAPPLGERFHAARGRLVMKPWGTLRVEDFSAAASRGRFTAGAEVVLEGLTLRRAVATIHVAQGESLPVTVADVPMGQVYGDVTVRAQWPQRAAPGGKRVDLVVSVPTLQVELPRSTGRPVQSLEADPTVRAGVHRGGSFVLLPLGPPLRSRAPSDLRVHATILLGGDVGVRRDTTVALTLRGRLVVDLGEETRVSGRLDLERGKLDLQGKQFTLDHGTVSFVGGDPTDPLVVASAYWDAADGTRVFADFSGPVKSGTLELRSEPALSQDEILAILLFGRPDGGFAAEGPARSLESTGIRVAGMAGNLVAQALNAAISGVTPDVTVRVDTSQAANPRPELVVQLSRRVSARLAYSLGVPAPGEAPDRAELTLSWRFDRDWSLVATAGDQGSTALDVVWRLRY